MCKLCVFAYGELGYVCLEELVREKEKVVALVTHTDSPGEQIWFRSVRDLARAKGIPVYEPRNPNDAKFIQMLKELEPDVILSFTYRQILSKEVLDIPLLGALNLHPSLLPRYRGRCPANWVLIHGESKTGVTLHYMEERVDAGDMVGQIEIKIAPDDTVKSLYSKLCDGAVELLRDTLPRVKSGTVERVPQDEKEATYFGGRNPEDGRIDWRKSALNICNLVRAVTRPYPGAFFRHGGEKVFCWKANLSAGSGKPGEVLEVREGKGTLVSCREGAIFLEWVQVEGGEEVRGEDWARGIRLAKGAVLT